MVFLQELTTSWYLVPHYSPCSLTGPDSGHYWFPLLFQVLSWAHSLPHPKRASWETWCAPCKKATQAELDNTKQLGAICGDTEESGGVFRVVWCFPEISGRNDTGSSSEEWCWGQEKPVRGALAWGRGLGKCSGEWTLWAPLVVEGLFGIRPEITLVGFLFEHTLLLES